MGRVRERVEEGQGKSQKKRDTGARTVEKVGKRRVSPMMGGSGRSRSRLSTAAGCRAISGPMRTEEGTRCDETHFQVEARKPPQLWTSFGSLDAEKLQCCRANAPCSSRIWKIRCRKTARRCGAKHISKPKITKHQG